MNYFLESSTSDLAISKGITLSSLILNRGSNSFKSLVIMVYSETSLISELSVSPYIKNDSEVVSFIRLMSICSNSANNSLVKLNAKSLAYPFKSIRLDISVAMYGVIKTFWNRPMYWEII